MTTGIESPQSITVQYYYKGFSILLTKRDPEVEVKPLLISAMASVDWAINTGLQPSWNLDTNKQALETKSVVHVEQKALPVDEFQKTCYKCGAAMITSKQGKLYCKDKCWLKEDK